MTKPCIHINGTSRNQLMHGYLEAHSAILVALEKLEAAAPNPRDYYMLEVDAFRSAVEEHVQRKQKLAEVDGELLELIEHCQ